MASQDHARIVLVGSTGAGKSQTGNTLLAEGRDVFRVSDKPTSETAKVIRWASNKYGWAVVDTPGMGDVPKKGSMADDEYKELCKQRRAQFFTDITKELHAHGGLVIYTLQSGRLDELKANHLKALSMVLHDCFTSSVVLLITHVPGKYALPNTTDPRELENSTDTYLAYLAEQRKEAEARGKVQFAAVLGVCDAFLSERHLAHPKHLPTAIKSMLKERIAYLAPGVAMNWQELVAEAYKAADFLKEQQRGIDNTTASLNCLKMRGEFLSKQITACDTTAAVAAAMNVAAAAAAATFWMAPIGALGAIAGAVVAAGPAIAALVYRRELGELDKKRDDLKAQLQRQKEALENFQGMSEEELRKHAAEIEELVFGKP